MNMHAVSEIRATVELTNALDGEDEVLNITDVMGLTVNSSGHILVCMHIYRTYNAHVHVHVHVHVHRDMHVHVHCTCIYSTYL